MQHIPRILEIRPFPSREHIAPSTAPANQRFEPAHLLHAEDFAVCELDIGVGDAETGSDGWEIGGAEGGELGVAVGVAVHRVGGAGCAGVTWGEGVGA